MFDIASVVKFSKTHLFVLSTGDPGEAGTHAGQHHCHVPH